MSLSINKAASTLIQPGTPVDEGLLNRIEMAYRAYDPCLGCATHSLPGRVPLQVSIRDPRGELLQVLRSEPTGPAPARACRGVGAPVGP
jgi:F420-non-reducing hydrogenase large subunit